MFIDRRKLQERLWELEAELADERQKTRRSAYIDAAALPRCKSLACASCAHIVTQDIKGIGVFVLGCGKDNPCGDFKPKDPYIPLDTMKEAISATRQSQSVS